MKASQLQTKRVPKKARFRLLHARIAGRRQRVTATASPTAHLDSDEPNLSVGRALIVILLIHIVAIGGYFFHNNFLAGKVSEAAVAPQPAALTPGAVQEAERLPPLRHGDQPYMFRSGDTYASIAAARGVLEDDLRRINDNIPLRPGRILKMPGRRILALEPTEMGQIRASSQTNAERGNIEGANDLLAANGAANSEAAGVPPRAIVVNQGAAALSGAAPTGSGAAPAGSGAASTHVVVSGDTLWRIANKHKVSTDELMKANGISDAKKLKLGMTLKLPAPH
jgi:LysM repeat protein